MLYDRWRRIARAHSDQLALFEIVGARRWTFGELFSAADNQLQRSHPIEFPQHASVDFVFSVLRAWRDGSIVCPLEVGQNQPGVSHSYPPGIVHLKMTSATTGKPRLVAFTAEQLIADADNIVASMGLRLDWPNLGIISLAH